MKHILPSPLVATLPLGNVLADAAQSNAKATLVYQHELPNFPGESTEQLICCTALSPVVADFVAKVRCACALTTILSS
jgi:hypothetical protein